MDGRVVGHSRCYVAVLRLCHIVVSDVHIQARCWKLVSHDKIGLINKVFPPSDLLLKHATLKVVEITFCPHSNVWCENYQKLLTCIWMVLCFVLLPHDWLIIWIVWMSRCTVHLLNASGQTGEFNPHTYALYAGKLFHVFCLNIWKHILFLSSEVNSATIATVHVPHCHIRFVRMSEALCRLGLSI